jgi:hypothetical protein
MRHDFVAMRLPLLLVALIACKGSSDSEPAAKPRHTAEPEDEPCDPKEPKVCMGDDVVACEPSGHLGRRLRACHQGCKRGRCVATCADDGTKLIYVVDTRNSFLKFDPRKLPGDPYTLIGQLRCGNGASGRPFSMSIDRHGVAWVVYDSGELFEVSIDDASCRPSAFSPGSGGFGVPFGMGFATDGPGATTEKLYVSATGGSNALGAIDTEASNLTPRTIGPLTASHERNAELTGTGEGRLFGFYPDSQSPAFVQEIDPKSGAPVGPQWTLGGERLAGVGAYAFAQWAGTFYIFVTSLDDEGRENSTVRVLDPKTGRYQIVREREPYRVSGAGVSTCAPERDH